MSAEYAIERIMDALAKTEGVSLNFDEPETDMMTGGSFFDLTLRGKKYEVLVVEIKGGAS